jgi:hypothetical protein
LRVPREGFPTYAFTDHKAQGQTIEHVIVDIGVILWNCFHSIYMVRSPFQMKNISTSQSHGLSNK